MKAKFTILAGLVIALLLAPAVSATTALKMSEADLATTADAIVTGTVGSYSTSWVGKTLVTLVEVEVDDVLKGSVGNQLTVMIPGGTDTAREYPVTVTYAGAPIMTPDEKVFLFLDASAQVSDVFTVAGFSQGKYSIVVSPDGVEKVSRDLTDLTLQAANGAQVRGGASHQSLNAFKQEIRSLLQPKVGRKPVQQ